MDFRRIVFQAEKENNANVLLVNRASALLVRSPISACGLLFAKTWKKHTLVGSCFCE